MIEPLLLCGTLYNTAVPRTMKRWPALLFSQFKSVHPAQHFSHACHPLSVTSALQDLITTSRLKPDDSQKVAASVLSALQNSIRQEVLPSGSQHSSATTDTASQQKTEQTPDSAPLQYPRGAYLWGTIGSGKTMLLDLFCSSLSNADKQQLGLCRLHFHEFMLTVHSRLHSLQESIPRTQGKSQFGLPVYRSDAVPMQFHALRQQSCCM